MRIHSRLISLFVLAALMSLALLLSGCGGETKTETTASCDNQPETIIPAASGKPQLIYFFRDT